MNILGINVSEVGMDKVISTIAGWIEKKEQNYVCATSVHGLVESQKDKHFRNILNAAGLVTCDGMPLVWLSRLKGNKNAERVYGPDLMLEFCRVSQEKGYRHFFYGGNDGIPERLRDNLCRKFPLLNVVGTYSPPFRALAPQEDEQVIDMINRTYADVIWVGISTPKQEKWMAEHKGKINASVMLGVGAAFDFLSGAKSQAPGWMQSSGLEWLFRLLTEPRRLWRRYLTANSIFVWLLLKDFFQLHREAKNEE